jgi:hypothetical protein
MVRLRRLDEDKKYRVGDTVFEIILKNANDGSSAYELLAGAFRVACLNSLVTQTYDMESLRVRHSGDVQTKVIEGTFRVLDTAEQTLQAPQDWPNGVTVRIYAEGLDIHAETAAKFNPMAGLRAPPRTRHQRLLDADKGKALSDAEIVAVWRAAQKMQDLAAKGEAVSGTFGGLVQLALLAGLRCAVASRWPRRACRARSERRSKRRCLRATAWQCRSPCAI